MTTLVKGPIKLVTDRPDTVRKVNIRAPELRLHGAGIVTDHNDGFPVVDGVVEFPALPGPAVLTLVTAGGAPLRSVEIVVPDEDTATLAECLDQIYTYDPPVVGRAQMFAREAGEHAARAEAGAARVGSAEQVGAWVGEAEVLRDDTVQAADRAETQAGVATEQAGLAGEHRQKAEDAEDSAHAAAGAAAEATKTEIRAEMDAKVSEAEGSAQSSGESAAASATSAGESATSAQEAGQSAQAAGEHLQDTRDLKSGIDAWWLDELLPTVDAVAADRAATQDDRRQTGEDRTTTGGHLTEVTRLHGEAEQARDDAQEAAANAQLGAPPEGWQREDMHVDVREDLSRARSALQDVPDATGEARGVIRLAGDLGGSATSPTVPGLSSKSDVGHEHTMSQITDLPEVSQSAEPNSLVQRFADGGIQIPEPTYGSDPATKNYVDGEVSGHRHDHRDIDNLDALIDERAGVLVREAPKMHVWDGEGVWVAPAGAGPSDSVLNLDSGEIHSVEDING